MRFLQRLRSRFASWFKTAKNPRSVERETDRILVPHELAAGELVSRFIYSKRKMTRASGRVKPEAFDPPRDGRLSVVHSTGLADGEIWEIGTLTLGTQPGRDTIYGRADVPVGCFVSRRLRAILDNDPFLRHTSVVGWPESSDPQSQNELRLQICLELSQDPAIKLTIPESPVTHATSLE